MVNIFIFDPLTLFDCQIFVGNKGESYRYVYPLNPSDVVYKIILGRAQKMEKTLKFSSFWLTLNSNLPAVLCAAIYIVQ